MNLPPDPSPHRSPPTPSASAPVPVFQTSPLLTEAGFVHAFFTRAGGVSRGPFASLNFTTNTGDSPENVAANLEIAARVLTTTPSQIYFLSQVHGTAHRVVDGSEAQSEVQKEEGDIVLTRTAGVAAAIRTADCVPVLLACPETGWVGAVHSGWAGCVRRVVPFALEALKAQGVGRLLAAIGPHISREAFEVGEDVAQDLVNASPDKEIVDRTGKRPHVDLRKMVRAQLLEGGLRDDDVDDVPGCTVLRPDWYYSFRRDGDASGRLLSAIVGREPV